jgi:hypothetical protein
MIHCIGCGQRHKKHELTNSFMCKKCINRDKTFRYKYNMSLFDYNELLEKQNSSCAICFIKEKNMDKKRFYVDHCHSTGEVRGLLCHTCNSGLGFFKDSPLILVQAFNYLTLRV